MAATGRIDGIFDGILRCWAWDPDRPGTRLSVAVLVDGRRLPAQRADRMRGDLRRHGIGDGAHGAEFALPLEVLDGTAHDFVLRTEGEDAADLAQARQEVPRRAHLLQGKVERQAGTEVIGWVWDRARPDATVTVEIVVEDLVLARLPAERYRKDLLNAGIGNGAHGFVTDLAALRPQPAPGAVVGVRAVAPDGHWEFGTATMPGAAPAPPRPSAGAILLDARAAAPARTALDAAREAERKRDFAAGIQHCDRGLARAPRDFDLLFLRGRLSLALNDLDAAERFSRAALAQRPAHPRPSVILARVHQARGQFAEAATYWAAVPPGDGQYRERLLKRGRCLMALGRVPEALGEFGAGVARDATDADALRGMAEAAEAAGGLRSAERHWRRLAALLPGDAQAADRLRELAARLAPPPGLASPLRNALLQHWPSGVAGEAGPEALEPTEGLLLRAPAGGPPLRFAAAGMWQRRPGELSGYGLWLSAAAAGAEIGFLLDPAAETGLRQGLHMAVEIRSLGPGGPDAMLLLAGGPAGERALARLPVQERGWLLRFDLRLDAPEAEALGLGRLRLLLRLGAPGTVLVGVPRPLAVMEGAPGGRGGFETPGLAAGLAALGLVPGAGSRATVA